MLRYISDEETQIYLRASDLVVLPYRDILNSGSALLALSFDRPVWLPEGNLADDLRDVVGEAWVYSGELTPNNLLNALGKSCLLPERTDGSHLEAFSSATVSGANG